MPPATAAAGGLDAAAAAEDAAAASAASAASAAAAAAASSGDPVAPSLDPEDERALLARRVGTLTSQLHELSVQHYRQVVDARESLFRAAQTGGRLDAAVDRLAGGELPELRASLASFQERGRALCDAHRRTMLTADLHTQLVDLLGLPQLMDSCARGGLGGAVDEALELYAFARTLRARHRAIAQSAAAANARRGRAGAAIIEAVVDEVEASAAQLRRQLLQKLRGQIDLPTCLRVVSFLKRLDAQRLRAVDPLRPPGDPSQPQPQQQPPSQRTPEDAEEELRREFLECRDAYLRTAVAASELRGVAPGPAASPGTGSAASASASGTGPYQSTLKVIQRNREFWFDVITQYLAIFGGDGAQETLSRWIGFKVEQFTGALAADVAKFESCGELATVLELAASFAASLSRVGCDFRALLPPMFLDRALELMRAQWTSASVAAFDALTAGDWGEPLPAALRPPPSASGTAPPPSLLEFPVAVDFCNALLRSLNELRAFACVELLGELAAEYGRALDVFVRGLEEYDALTAGGSAAAPGAGGGRAAALAPDAAAARRARFLLFVDMAAADLVPYLARCFGTVFGFANAMDVAPLVARLRRLSGASAGGVPDAPDAGKPGARRDGHGGAHGGAAAGALGGAGDVEQEEAEDAEVEAEAEAGAAEEVSAEGAPPGGA